MASSPHSSLQTPSPLNACCPSSELMNWTFMLDNCFDEPGMFGANSRASQVIIESIMSVFKPTLGGRQNSMVILPSDWSRGGMKRLRGMTYILKTCPNMNLNKTPMRLDHIHYTPLEPVSEPALHENIACDNGSTYNSLQAYITKELACILTSLAVELWSGMCIDMPLSQQARFCQIIKGYLGSILKETYHLPDTHTYLQIQSHTLAWYPFALLTEYTLCMELDQEAITNHLVVALQQTVCESIILVNDITSFHKEYESGDEFNIIMVLCFNKLKGQCKALPKSWANLATQDLLQESMNEVCEITRRRNQACMCLIEKIKGSSVLIKKPGMGAFLEAMGNYVAGNIYWHFTNGRYAISGSGRIDNKQIIQSINILASHTLHIKRVSGDVTH